MSEEQEKDLEAIKNRIESLLNLTVENGATIQEAEVAMRKSSELMTKHLIKEHQLGSKKGDCETRITGVHRKNEMMSCTLGNIANTFDCHCIVSKINGTKFFGFPMDLDIAEYVTSVVFETLEFEISRYRKSADYKEETQVNKVHATKVINDFIHGYCAQINLRLKEIKEERNRQFQEATGTSLMVVRKDAVDAELKTAFPRLKSGSAFSVRGAASGARANGEERAKQVRLNTAVGQGQATAMLG